MKSEEAHVPSVCFYIYQYSISISPISLLLSFQYFKANPRHISPVNISPDIFFNR